MYRLALNQHSFLLYKIGLILTLILIIKSFQFLSCGCFPNFISDTIFTEKFELKYILYVTECNKRKRTYLNLYLNLFPYITLITYNP